MSTFKSIQPEQATGSTKQLFDGLQRQLGVIPNLAKQLANSPAALKAYLNWGATLAGGTLSPALSEQIALAVANTNHCEYCLSAHTALGSLAGLSPELLHAAQIGEATDKKSAAALHFAVEIVNKQAIGCDLVCVAVVGAAGSRTVPGLYFDRHNSMGDPDNVVGFAGQAVAPGRDRA